MDPTDQANLAGEGLRFEREEEVSREFGAYRAEWVDERLFELFRAPQYLGSLMAVQPMVLQGGRGTGKTTVLKGLSFRGVHARSGGDMDALARAPFIGLYWKVMMSQVAPFHGEEVSAERWDSLFSHYLNLIHCGLIADYLVWRKDLGVPLALRAGAVEEVAECLALEGVETLDELLATLRRAHRRFEVYVNNVAGEKAPPLSMLGVPQRVFAEAVCAAEARTGSRFCFLIDEYENLSDYQQRIFNTLIKESGGAIVYKVGVREEGWRERATLNPTQRLEEPQDFRRVDIVQELGRGGSFSRFAASVCEGRLARLDQPTLGSMGELMPELTEEAEAELLELDKLLAARREELLGCAPDAAGRSELEELAPLQAYALLEWSDAHKTTTSLEEVVADYLARPGDWSSRFGNYRYTLLFTIRKGKSGLRKYYAGWETHCLLAAGNIRYLLQLVETSLRLQLRADLGLDRPLTNEIQTRAAQQVGEKNLFELESVSGTGNLLLRLMLGFGRVFGRLAAGGSAHRPETNQFELSRRVPKEELPDADQWERLELILTDAVMNSALIRTPANKLQERHDIAADLFIVHPIFSPFFVFSHRRKRKMMVRPLQVLALIDDPSATIGPLIDSSDDDERAGVPIEENLPDQMRLFAEYYRAT